MNSTLKHQGFSKELLVFKKQLLLSIPDEFRKPGISDQRHDFPGNGTSYHPKFCLHSEILALKLDGIIYKASLLIGLSR